MGEYFNWVNVDRKEYLCPSDFNLGNKLHESMYRENPLLCALRDLLSHEWKDNKILFLGDECEAPENNIASEIFQLLYFHSEQIGYAGNFFDTIRESYRNISCLFKDAEIKVRKNIDHYLKDGKSDFLSCYNEYGIDINHPFDGLFLRTGKNFRYTINFTKKECYSPGITKILYLDGSKCEYLDPLPILMGYGRTKPPGAWLGNVIGAADEINEDITVLKEIYLDW